MDDNIKVLQKWIDDSDNIVFFGGAGVSTASGIKDFRSKDGLYNMKYNYPPELILSHDFFYGDTEEFYIFYKEYLNTLNVEPNIIHKYLAKLEKKGKLKGIITQNIDNLHEKAGSKKIYNLHGNINYNHCIKCGKKYDGKYVFNSDKVPVCECGGIIKPDVVLYGEMLDDEVVENSIKLIEKADLLIVAGTSLTVYPAAGFINYYRNNKMVIINNDKTSYDTKANLVINKNLKDVFNKLK